MADLIGPEALDVLERRARVIDLVKIGGIVQAVALRDQLLLVGQLPDRRADGQRRALRVPEDRLAQPGLAVRAADAHVAGALALGLQGQAVPLEHGHMVLCEVLRQRRVIRAVVGDLDAVAAHADARVEHQLRRALLETEDGALPRHGHEALRRGGIAQIGKGGEGVDPRDQQEPQSVKPSASPFGRGGGQSAVLKRGQAREEHDEQQRRRDGECVIQYQRHKGPSTLFLIGRSRPAALRPEQFVQLLHRGQHVVGLPLGRVDHRLIGLARQHQHRDAARVLRHGDIGV